jgi:hypothetical protein
MDAPIIGAAGKKYPAGTILDQYGHPIGWPHRSGNLEIMNGDSIVVKTQLVEIVLNPSAVAAPANTWQMPDQPNLRNAAIWGLEVFSNTIVPLSPLSGNALVPEANYGSLFLTMQDYASFNFLQNKPARTLQIRYGGTTANYGHDNPQGFIGQHVNWPLTSLYIANTAFLNSETYSFLMEVRYSYKDNWQRDGLGKNFGDRS